MKKYIFLICFLLLAVGIFYMKYTMRNDPAISNILNAIRVGEKFLQERTLSKKSTLNIDDYILIGAQRSDIMLVTIRKEDREVYLDNENLKEKEYWILYFARKAEGVRGGSCNIAVEDKTWEILDFWFDM